MLYDITRTVTTKTAVFPGDTPYSAAPMLRLNDGASVNLATITTTPHVGTHADAYYHYIENGANPAAMPLGAYIGQARVVSTGRRSGALTVDDFPAGSLDGIKRLLVHSWVSEQPDETWIDDFPYPGVALIEALAARGVVLLGLDVASMDSADSKDLPGHHALARLGMVNLENLVLRGVPDGDYELIALPLKLADGNTCASPVRAVLRTL
jgi:arylformamidase